jgi:hypothetical protein
LLVVPQEAAQAEMGVDPAPVDTLQDLAQFDEAVARIGNMGRDLPTLKHRFKTAIKERSGVA